MENKRDPLLHKILCLARSLSYCLRVSNYGSLTLNSRGRTLDLKDSVSRFVEVRIGFKHPEAEEGLKLGVPQSVVDVTSVRPFSQRREGYLTH